MTLLEAVELNLDHGDIMLGDIVDDTYAFSHVWPEDNVTNIDDYEVGDIIGVDDDLLEITVIENGYVELFEVEVN